MENHVPPPSPGGSAVALAPHEAEAFHEFFRIGVQRDVLLVGEPAEMWSHYVSRSQRKLCTAPTGLCLMCDKSQSDPDVGRRQLDFVFPTFIRAKKEKQFHQRVAVFPRSAGQKVCGLCSGTYRGRLLTVERGKSNRLGIVAAGLPTGFPDYLPPTFCVEPFIRARFALRADPANPPLVLPPIQCEEAERIVERPKPLAINHVDTMSLDEAAKMLPRYREMEMHRLAAMCERVLGLPPGGSPPQIEAVPEVLDVTVKPGPARPMPEPERDDAEEQARLSAARKKPSHELTHEEAVKTDRVLDYVLGGVGLPVPGSGANTLPFPQKTGQASPMRKRGAM